MRQPSGPLTIRSVRTRAVSVPMRRPLRTSAQTITHAPLLLIDLQTHQGVVGRSYLFCYLASAAGALAAMVAECAGELKDGPVAPVDIGLQLAKHFRLIGHRGITNMATAGIDVACWDALAIAADQPLALLLGAQPRPIQAYNSNGLGLGDIDGLATEAGELAERFGAVKLRLGRPDPAADLAAVRSVRRALPSGAHLMVDYNQALSGPVALDRCRPLDDEGVYWIEEPIRHDDYLGCAALANRLDTPIQIGENFQGPTAMAQSLAHRASDFVMPDLERIGGVTGWVRAAALAAAQDVPVSSHLFPEVSAHLLAATPSAHWLEYVDWASPILQEPLQIVGGHAVVPERPGHGMVWDEGAVATYALA